MTSITEIIKVNLLKDENTIKTIYVFYGFNENIDTFEVLFKREPRNIVFHNKGTGTPIFNDIELEQIKKNNIEVKFSDQQIHYDDTIETIKLKIMNEYSNTISIDEIYLFCLKEELLNPANVYNSLTQNGRLPLTKTRFDQFILNIIYDSNKERVEFDIPEKTTYDYDDILSLNITDRSFYMSKVLGQKFFIVSNEYLFVANPFNVVDFDKFIEDNFRTTLTTFNNYLLLNTGDIMDNNIYLCLASDVYEDSIKKGFSEIYITKIYYPLLFINNEISSLIDLKRNTQKLLTESRELLTTGLIDNFQSVDLFYQIYNERKSELDYKKKGIKSINVVIKPTHQIKIPLDVIFKLIHATDHNPLIKFNAGVRPRKENVFRLFADKITKDGRKIPFLSKSNIYKLIKTIGRSKGVSVYIIYQETENTEVYSIICEFEENGNIHISCDFDNILSIEEIENLFKNAVNPIIEDIKLYLEQNGYSIQLFENLIDENVKIEKIDYQSIISIGNKIKLNDIIGCLTSIFIVETRDYTKGINMRYKRVSNFNNMTSSEAFVIEQVKQKNGLRGDSLIIALTENYKMKRDVAISLLEKITSNLQVERGVKGTVIEIKVNPGFKTVLTYDKFKNEITITVENIDNINYLYILPIYLDSFIRLTQDKTSTNIDIDRINTICGIEEFIEPLLNDFVSIAEGEGKIPFIDGEILSYQDIEDYNKDSPDDEPVQNAFDLIYGEGYNDESDEDENENGGKLSGGEGTSSSESSISTLALSDNEEKKLDDIISPSSSSSSYPSSPDDKSLSGELEPKPKPKSETVSESSLSLPSEKPLSSTSPSSISSSVLSSDDEEEKEKEEEEEKPVVKTSKKFNLVSSKDKNKIERNVDGLKLINTNPFQLRLEELDPVVFDNKKQVDKFHAYSRSCPFTTRRQPVIVTEEEMEKIDNETPGFLENGKKNLDIIKYGSDPEKQFYFMCPRYWCMKTNSPISPEDVKSGKCGKIIPRNASKIEPGHYVYEFYEKGEHGSQDDDKYKVHKPGFYEKEKNAEGYCMPCCFKKWDTPSQVERRKECSMKEKEKEKELDELEELEEHEKPEEKDDNINQEENEKETEGEKEIKLKNKYIIKKKIGKEEYVLGPERIPLDKGRWGYLPMGIQKMLHEINAECHISKTNTNVKLHHNCLLRKGVEYSKNQSFIACIADAIFYIDNPIIPSITQMKNKIIKSLNIDTFITYQNGDLMNNFMNNSLPLTKETINSKYTKSKIYSKVNKKKIQEMDYFKSVIRSFENFISFLKSDDSIIDYTYLWDIISKPNSELFKQGINLIIFEIPNNDTTNNIELICPTNHYSNEIYNARKPSLIIIKNGDIFEPIYKYRNEGKKLIINKTFKEHDPHLSSNMRLVFKKIIKPLLNNSCLPLSSMPKIYNFKQSLILSLLIDYINKTKNNYNIVKQIVNFQSKVVYLLVQDNDGNKGVVPCYPSSINPAYEYIFMDDESIYSEYDETVSFLNNLNKDSNNKIPCSVEFKVIEDEMIVGIITQTNQFVQLSSPEPISDVTDDIKILDNGNYLSADLKTVTNKENPPVDIERVEYIKKIKLETNFYNVFRNTVRILLNKYSNITLREKIEEEIKNNYNLYKSKLYTIIDYLKELINDDIIFSDEYDYRLIGEITTCIILDNDKCNKQKPLCAFSTGNTCQLFLPKQNLLNGKNNEIYYFGKMADELIRYNRINSFIFKPQMYLSFENLSYNLRDDEIIVPQSTLLQKEFLEDLIPLDINKYVKYNSYDTVNPIKTQIYDNKIVFNEDIEEEDIIECVKTESSSISSSIWKKCFPVNYGEILYDKTINCGFNLIIDIIQYATRESISINIIKKDLLKQYAKYFHLYEDKLIDILIHEGKKTLGIQLREKTISFENFIYTNDYFVSNFDIWLIMEKYNIPAIFISGLFLSETNYKNTIFTVYTGIEPKPVNHIFIVCPGKRSDSIPKYKLIKSPDNQVMIPLTVIRDVCKLKIQTAINECVTIERFLNNYIIQKTTTYIPKTPKKLIIKKKKMLKLLDEEDEEIEREKEREIPIQEKEKEKGRELLPSSVEAIIEHLVPAQLCNQDCSKQPIKTKCNSLTKRCIAPKKTITKKKLKIIQPKTPL